MSQPPPPQLSADGRHWWNGYVWVDANQVSQFQTSTVAPPIPPAVPLSIPKRIAKWDVIVVAVLTLTVFVVTLGLNAASNQGPAPSSISSDPSIGATITLGKELSGRTGANAIYNFTTTGAYQVTWSAKANGVAGGCTFLGAVSNPSHESLDLAANAGSVNGSESGFHVLRIRVSGCAWTLKVR